jgi:hypothetical protein
MTQPHIEIRIQLGHWPDRKKDKWMVLPLEEYVVREAAQVLDFPSPDAAAVVRAFITTPDRVIRETQLRRRDLAEAVAAQVKARILEMLGENDLDMGYKRAADQSTEGGE